MTERSAPERLAAELRPEAWSVDERQRFDAYRELHRRSLADGPAFWTDVARDLVRWRTPFTRPLDWDPPFARWFPDGTLNVAENCLDRHRGTPTWDRPAYLWEGEDGQRRTVSYAALAATVDRLAAGLAADGFGPDDVAALFLPMVPELPMAMLALARLGIPFSVVFSGFSGPALADRIRGLGARLVITADAGIRRGRSVGLKRTTDAAIAAAGGVDRVVVVPRTGESVPMVRGRDVTWDDLLAGAAPAPSPTAWPSDHLLFLLYSSGTTGAPKPIAHGTGGYLTYAAATMRWVFDPRPSDVYWCAADIGWVTGHSYIVFGPLLHGVTGVLYEGALDHPAPDRMWSIAERYRVSILYTSPTALRAQRRYGDEGLRGHDLSTLRLLGTVGESINPDVWRWYADVVGGGRCPVVDTWWQTETGGIVVSGAPGLDLVPPRPGSATLPLPGLDVDVVDEHGAPTHPGTRGFVVIRRPWPGMLLTLRGDDERFRATYWGRFPGLYYAGDFAVRDDDGYLWFLGRADEVLKVAGHRLGTIEIEDALVHHPAVAEAAVCGVPDPIKGEVPVAFVVLRTGRSASPALAEELAAAVGERIGAIARPAAVHFVRGLPKTRSGKILRRVVRAAAEGRSSLGDTSTLEDEAPVDELREAFRRLRADLGAGPTGPS